jgi:GNAT superfamily N-acetyltransferase
LYLTAMAVLPARQQTGIGRLCAEEARRFAREWPADSIRLDAWDAPCGAAGFMRSVASARLAARHIALCR